MKALSISAQITVNAAAGDTQLLHEQGKVTLQLVQRTLEQNPPIDFRCSQERELALYCLDGIFHNTLYDNSSEMKAYRNWQAQRVIGFLKQPVDSGLQICKVYNDGFIVRSASTTIAFDLCGRDGVIIPDSLMREIINYCDALFISHEHGDHADIFVTKTFIQLGKPVVAPTTFMSDETRIIHHSSNEITQNILTLPSGEITYKVLPGHQNTTATTNVICNHNAVTLPEGYTVVHIGDQAHQEDMVWIKEAYKIVPNVDLLFAACWMGNITSTVNGYNPRIVFTGHENELFHPIESRIPYWKTYQRYKHIDRTCIIMEGGECYHYERPK